MEVLLENCKQVLAENRSASGDYTRPAPGPYPHQWLWDSCFTAIGLAHYDVERAKTEITSLFRGQWANGMLPNMIFDGSVEYATDRRIWDSRRSPNAPEDVATSGITQPPMLAEAIVRVGDQMDEDDRLRWYKQTYPALLAYHSWLYTERDPRSEGLVFLIHPYESGLDNSPPWVNQLHMNHSPFLIKAFDNPVGRFIIESRRRDTKHISPGERIDDIDALLYHWVIWRLRSKNWDIRHIEARSHFMVQDLTFNSILIRANHHLAKIAKDIGHEIPEWLADRARLGRRAITEKLWDPESQQFYSRNYISADLIKSPSLATLMPLYAGVGNQQQTERIIHLLKSPDYFGTENPVPSVPVSYPEYHELKYWQGPVWINTNWLIIDGLRRAKQHELAGKISVATLDLVKTNGVSEYYSARTGQPAGARNFSWTAALIIDLLADTKK